MPANTAKGYPYPLGTDPVADGDDAIKNLADAVDAKLGLSATGTFPGGSLATGVATVSVTFPAGRFTATPVVQAISLHPDTTCGVLSITGTTSCQIGVMQRNSTGAQVTTGTSRTGTWIAVQV